MSRASMPTVAPQHAVQVVSSTWVRDSHDLFDFESRQLQAKTFTVRTSSTCLRSGTDVEVLAEGEQPPAGMDSLVRIVERGGHFLVDKAASSATCSKKLWMVVRDVAPTGLRLCESDVLKLGRFKFRVRQLVSEQQVDTLPDLGLDDNGTVCKAHYKDVESKCCRICLMEGIGEDDPLIMPCQCKGSIEYIHLKCLRHWTSSRLNLSENPLGSYFYRPLHCELCKASYPTYVNNLEGRLEHERTPLLEVPRTQPPYIVLENVVRSSRENSRGLHVISLAEKALMLGRGHESDVRIGDVSISRCHASIRYDNGQFLLQDNGSKFGTLVAMKRPRQIEATKPVSLQIGRTVLNLSLTTAPPLTENGAGAAMASVPQAPPRPASAPVEEDNMRAWRFRC